VVEGECTFQCIWFGRKIVPIISKVPINKILYFLLFQRSHISDLGFKFKINYKDHEYAIDLIVLSLCKMYTDNLIEVFQNPYLTTILYFSIKFKRPPYSYVMIKKYFYQMDLQWKNILQCKKIVIIVVIIS
jgi:hypothetical protein